MITCDGRRKVLFLHKNMVKEKKRVLELTLICSFKKEPMAFQDKVRCECMTYLQKLITELPFSKA